MSRKLKGAQCRYDARNVEALAAQMALKTWRRLLLGQKFEKYSDHDSLQYLFTRKSPSHRILFLCEFLADFDCNQHKYVPGAHKVVPDFWSCPWDSSESNDMPAIIHLLTACTSRANHKGATSQASSQTRPSVVVLPTWQGHIATRVKHGRTGLWSVSSDTHETSRESAARTVLGLEQDLESAPLSHVLPIWMASHCGAPNSSVIRYPHA